MIFLRLPFPHILLMINVTSFGIIPDYTWNSGRFSLFSLCFASKHGEDHSCFFSKNMSTLGRSNPQDPPSGCDRKTSHQVAAMVHRMVHRPMSKKSRARWSAKVRWDECGMVIPCHCNPNIMGIYIYMIYVCIL